RRATARSSVFTLRPSFRRRDGRRRECSERVSACGAPPTQQLRSQAMAATQAAPAPAAGTSEKRSWLPLAILGAAQFVMVLDSSVMNVSISQIVADLNTSIQGVQSAITMYTLVMAAFMLVGAKLGDMYGRDRIFAIGLAVYACGSLITALSQDLG